MYSKTLSLGGTSCPSFLLPSVPNDLTAINQQLIIWTAKKIHSPSKFSSSKATQDKFRVQQSTVVEVKTDKLKLLIRAQQLEYTINSLFVGNTNFPNQLNVHYTVDIFHPYILPIKRGFTLGYSNQTWPSLCIRSDIINIQRNSQQSTTQKSQSSPETDGFVYVG